VGETISLNIGALETLKNVKISTQCSDKEETNFAKLLGGFQNIFAWSYEDLHGFYPSLTKNAIPIKEGMKPTRQNKGLLTLHLRQLFKRSWKSS
jgi:hypothetical protein